MEKIKYFRCHYDHRIVTDRMIRKGICLGHQLSAANYVSFWEWILIKLHIIR
ncbi:MAG: hypothetical protein V1709_06055 [Planctomycetota bacterium]